MKIVHVVECFSGGVFEFLVQLINGMKGHQHLVVYGKRENTPIDFVNKFPNNTEFIYWESAQRTISVKKDIKSLFELRAILKKISNIDVIHLHSSKAGFLGRIASLCMGRPQKVIYTSHGASFLRTDVNTIKKYLYIVLEKIASRCKGSIVACSESEKNVFLKYNIENVITINNGVEINLYENNTQKIKTNRTTFTIGTCGRISTQKNPCAFNIIAEKFMAKKNIRFVWIGDGELRNDLKSENIVVTGWLEKKDVKRKLMNIDLYLSTSLWEGMPLSVLEAMSLKKPLVLSNCIGNRDLVHHGEDGFLFRNINEAINCIEELVTEDDLRISFGSKIYEKLERDFSIEKMIENYLKLYSSIT